jgi:hypothetical protein
MSDTESIESASSDVRYSSIGVPDIPSEDIEPPRYEQAPPYEHPPTYARTTLEKMTWEELYNYLHRITDEESMRIDETQGFELLQILERKWVQLSCLHTAVGFEDRPWTYCTYRSLCEIECQLVDILLYAFHYTRFLLRRGNSVKLVNMLESIRRKCFYMRLRPQGKILLSCSGKSLSN